jgi:hypothetical protein
VLGTNLEKDSDENSQGVCPPVLMVAFKQIPDLPAIIGILLIQAGILVINFFSKMEAH